MTAGESDSARETSVDTSRPNVARMYDFWLGGKNNFEADRKEAERMLQVLPDLPRLTRENRMFLRRAVHWLAAERGIRQFLDAGSGLPTASNTHEVAQSAAPGVRVAYVDKDPVVVSHANALLADGRDVIAAGGDVTDPAAILADPRVAALIQPGEPCAVILAAVLHFFSPEQARDIVTEFARLIPPGSYLVVSIGASATTFTREYSTSVLYDYSPDDVRGLLSGFTLVNPPGLADALDWTPGTPVSGPPRPGARVLAAIASAAGGA